MATLPYMQLYVADYLADTAHLSATQHGAYLLLIMNYWQRGKPLKNCNERLANVARMSGDEWIKIRDSIAEFFTVTETEWVHKRIEQDLLYVAAKSEKAKIAGQASAYQRYSNGRSAEPQQMSNHTDKIQNRTDKKESKNRGSRFTLTHPPTEWIDYCNLKRPDLDPGSTFDEFSNYWMAKPGKDGRKLDWYKTWQNWIMNQREKRYATGRDSIKKSFTSEGKRLAAKYADEAERERQTAISISSEPSLRPPETIR